jgi:deoxyribonuclease-1
MKLLSTLVLLTFTAIASAQSPFEDLKDTELKDELHRLTGEGYISLSYKGARIKLFNEIYLEKDEKGYFNTDVYCNAKYYRKFNADTPGKELPDQNVFNTEHTWAQSRFNESLSQEVQKTDLHHLFPTYSKINAERGNYQFANVGVPVAKPLYCNLSKLGTSIGVAKGTYFEPPVEHKGNVARALFYFSVRYQIAIEPNEEIFLKFWHMLDPVDEKEKARHELIALAQKNRNPFIDHPEIVLQISDF